MAKREIVLVPYRPEWAVGFEEMRRRILTVCGDRVIDVLHIGSTAIPGIVAKPVIDMLPLIRRFEDGRDCVKPLAELGFEYMGAYGIAGRHYSRRGMPRTHQVHMFAADHSEVGRLLRFRDYLREHPEAARAYAKLKQELAARFFDDVAAYAEAKTAFCARIEGLAAG